MSRILRFTVPQGAALPSRAQPEPGTSEQAYLEARKLNEAGKPSEAMPLLEVALALDPANEEAIVELGLTLMDVGRSDEALAHYSRILAERPTLARARLSYANCLLRRVELEKAVQELETCLQQRPGWEEVYPPLITALCRLDRVAEATAHLAALRSASVDTGKLEMLAKLIDRASGR